MQDLIINYLKFEKGIYNYGKPIAEIICSSITEEAMDLSSWLRGNIKKTRKSDSVKRQEEVLGVTDQLIDTVKSFSFHTFKNFPLQGTFFLLLILPHVVWLPGNL